MCLQGTPNTNTNTNYRHEPAMLNCLVVSAESESESEKVLLASVLEQTNQQLMLATRKQSLEGLGLMAMQPSYYVKPKG